MLDGWSCSNGASTKLRRYGKISSEFGVLANQQAFDQIYRTLGYKGFLILKYIKFFCKVHFYEIGLQKKRCLYLKWKINGT